MWSLFRVVNQKTRDEFDSFDVCVWFEHLIPWYWTNMRESKLSVIWIHSSNLFFGRCSKDFYYFDNLIWATLAREYRHCQHQFGYDASNWPKVNRTIVFSVSKNEFWGPIISWTDVWNVWFSHYQLLCTTKITKLYSLSFSVHKNILRLNVTMAYAHRMNVSDSP